MYIQEILAAFPPSARIAAPVTGEALAEPLTNREMDVLKLMANRLSNKEIAAILVISPATVKRHTINIYQKLNVNGRRQAVTAATDLGLLLVP